MEITFETAKLAKEKGFKQIYEHGWPIISSGYTEKGKPTIIMDIKHFHYLSPEQYILHKWLRNKCNLHVIPYILSALDLKDYSVEVLHPRPQGTMGCDSMLSRENSLKRFKNYEDVLEFGMQEALKLIITQ